MVNSFVFDEQFYLTQNPDVAAAVSRGDFASGQAHFNDFGRFEARDPNAYFDTSYYLGEYPDVAAAGVNPFQHFMTFGAAEGRTSNVNEDTAIDTDGNGVANEFDADAYLAANTDVQTAIDNGQFTSAYQHYVLFGQFEDRPGAQLMDGTMLMGPYATGADGGGANPGQTFTLTPGTDFADNAGSIRNGPGAPIPSDFKFSSANDQVIASSATLTAGDTLVDASTNDQDVLKYTGNTVASIAAGVTVQNIENLNANLNNAVNSAADLSGFTGLRTVDLSGSITAGNDVQFNAFADSGVSEFHVTSTGGPLSSVSIVDAAADQDITITGSNVVTNVVLGEGDNAITTGTADDFIFVGNGNNVIDAGAGANNVTVGDGDNSITAGAGDDTFTIGNGANTIVLGDGANSLNGGNGDNSVTGGSGVDTVTLGNGANVIDTGAGADQIVVGTGDNAITAGAGADNVTLGAGGVDTLLFNTGDSKAVAGGFDAITGFEVTGTGQDHLDFGGPAGSAANLTTVGPVADFAAALVAAQAEFNGDVSTVYFAADAGGDSFVFADVNNDNVIDYAVQLTGIANSTTIDFHSFA